MRLLVVRGDRRCALPVRLKGERDFCMIARRTGATELPAPGGEERDDGLPACSKEEDDDGA